MKTWPTPDTQRLVAIFTGHELLNGQTLNSNLTLLGRICSDRGWNLAEASVVSDSLPGIAAALTRQLEAGAGVVLICGGLGPTSDDLTRASVAAALELELYTCPQIEALVRGLMAQRGRAQTPDYYRRQSERIRGSALLPNRVGIAPGLSLRTASGALVMLLPGPPAEFAAVLDDGVLPTLSGLLPALTGRGAWLLMGCTESEVERRYLASVAPFVPGIEVAYCARPGQVRLTLCASAQGAEALLAAADARLAAEFGPALVPGEDLAVHVLELLRARGLKLGLAESCTGGMIAASLTAISGSSAVLLGSLVTYANSAKQALLQVPTQVLLSHGAVSAECAKAMAEGAAKALGADCAIAVTGIAGPGGATPEKPVGTVHIATVLHGSLREERRHFRGNREAVREQTVLAALDQLRRQVMQT